MPVPEIIPVALLTPRWSEHIMLDVRPEPLCVVRKDFDAETFSLTLAIPAPGSVHPTHLGVPVRVGAPDGDFDAQGRCLAIRRWGLRKLGPGVWALAPSIVNGSFHAYVVLCDVPEPAPFAEET